MTTLRDLIRDDINMFLDEHDMGDMEQSDIDAFLDEIMGTIIDQMSKDIG